VLEGFDAEQWHVIEEGKSIGYKRIEMFPTEEISKVRLKITEAIASPVIKQLKVYHVDEMKGSGRNESMSNSFVVGDWSTDDYTTEWEEHTFDLTSYIIEKVGYFELKFSTVDHERPNPDGYGLDFSDWVFEVQGGANPDAIKMTRRGVFRIDHSQHVTVEMSGQNLFKVKIRRKPAGALGTIELKMLGLE
jgi:alpha-L-fucosidase